MTCNERHHHNAPRAVIFDLDGTLVDSLNDIANAINEALSNIGLSQVDSARIRTWVGDGLPALCDRAATYVDAAHRSDQLLVEARRTYDAHCTRTTVPYPNVLETLDLMNRARVPMAVLSNKPDPFVARIIAHLALEKYFVACRGYRTEADKKPSPRVALMLAEMLSAPPGRVAVVGDSTVDIETAQNANMRSIGVTWGLQSREKISQKNPDWIVDDALEILKIFQVDSTDLTEGRA
ncbi:MAG: HAD hydrolase-like protein [Phycisphaerales bacterium]|nr:HAD hydrolase-like protein [Phycisphaerales bacterium]MCB9864845.1 HAD hydrolase-like protein [Phycisphaerales bacterium]